MKPFPTGASAVLTLKKNTVGRTANIANGANRMGLCYGHGNNHSIFMKNGFNNNKKGNQ
jgi:hypothetical protein